ncbi:hypothetical protein, partial [Pseudomonas aeruginosa]
NWQATVNLLQSQDTPVNEEETESLRTAPVPTTRGRPSRRAP